VYDSDIVDVESVGDLWQTVDAGSGDQIAEKLSVVGDLGGDSGQKSL